MAGASINHDLCSGLDKYLPETMIRANLSWVVGESRSLHFNPSYFFTFSIIFCLSESTVRGHLMGNIHNL